MVYFETLGFFVTRPSSWSASATCNSKPERSNLIDFYNSIYVKFCLFFNSQRNWRLFFSWFMTKIVTFRKVICHLNHIKVSPEKSITTPFHYLILQIHAINSSIEDSSFFCVVLFLLLYAIDSQILHSSRIDSYPL